MGRYFLFVAAAFDYFIYSSIGYTALEIRLLDLF